MKKKAVAGSLGIHKSVIFWGLGGSFTLKEPNSYPLPTLSSAVSPNFCSAILHKLALLWPFWKECSPSMFASWLDEEVHIFFEVSTYIGTIFLQSARLMTFSHWKALKKSLVIAIVLLLHNVIVIYCHNLLVYPIFQISFCRKSTSLALFIAEE